MYPTIGSTHQQILAAAAATTTTHTSTAQGFCTRIHGLYGIQWYERRAEIPSADRPVVTRRRQIVFAGRRRPLHGRNEATVGAAKG